MWLVNIYSISILAWLSSRDPHIGPRDDNQAIMEMLMY
jgi:hypothetical protein